MNRKIVAIVAAGMLALSGCGSADAASEEAVAVGPEATTEQVVEEAQASGPAEGESCFTVSEVGVDLSLSWELTVAARGASDQKDYIDDLMDDGEDLYEDIEDNLRCKGATDLADFNLEVAQLNLDVILGEDTDAQYQSIAELGNKLLEASDDEGESWSYEFISDPSETGF